MAVGVGLDHGAEGGLRADGATKALEVVPQCRGVDLDPVEQRLPSTAKNAGKAILPGSGARARQKSERPPQPIRPASRFKRHTGPGPTGIGFIAPARAAPGPA